MCFLHQVFGLDLAPILDPPLIYSKPASLGCAAHPFHAANEQHIG
jgi:hypothetical protein